jgi:DNA repair protein RadC
MEVGGVYMPKTNRPVLGGPAEVATYVHTLYPPRFPQEAFIALLVDARNRITQAILVSLGTLTASIVHPREVFAPAITHRAASILLAHNHPSGDPTPSEDDDALTRRLTKIGELLGIEVLDHVILGSEGRYHSMRATGAGSRSRKD